MTPSGQGRSVEDTITLFAPRSVPEPAASFAREVVRACAPGSSTRARALLFACSKLGAFGLAVGLELRLDVMCHPSVIERFIVVGARQMSSPTRRTLRTNLRAVATRVLPGTGPAPTPLPRERSKAPYSEAEVAAYLRLADAQPTSARRMRANGLICLGAGAGLMGADLRQVRGKDVVPRCSGVVIEVKGRRPRVVPLLARYHDRLLAAAELAGGDLLIGGADPARRNVTTPLISSLSGGADLSRLDTGRLRATWLAEAGPGPGAAGVPGRSRDLLPPAPRRRGGPPARRLGVRGGGASRGAKALSETIPLAGLEAVVDRSEVAARVESLLPVGVRPRQLSVRALLTGMLLTQADHRPAHLTRVHQALLGLCEDDRARLGIVARWPSGPHTLTYRQVEYTFGLVDAALARTTPSGAPSEALAGVADALLEASVPEACKGASSSYAVDWTDHETFSCPPVETGGDCADPEASWGHRRGDGPGQRDELFFGYYLQVATMVRKEDGPPVPELARRILLTSCHIDPPPAFLSVMASMAASGVVVGDVLGDSGYAHRVAANWALPLRQMGASLVMDLHPTDRGPKGTFAGATISNGNLYCPMTPTALLGMAPLARGATKEETAAHDRKTAEASHYKLGRISATDSDGYHRVACPATRGKVRCPLRPSSMAASHERPEVLTPPENPPTCCTQATVTVPPVVNAKTAQKHDYPGASWRASYARRSAAERTNSTVKDPASNDTTRGWCRLMGLSAITLFLACTFIVRNERVLVAFSAREREDARRAGRGLEPKTRRRRRKTLADLAEGAPAHAPP